MLPDVVVPCWAKASRWSAKSQKVKPCPSRPEFRLRLEFRVRRGLASRASDRASRGTANLADERLRIIWPVQQLAAVLCGIVNEQPIFVSGLLVELVNPVLLAEARHPDDCTATASRLRGACGRRKQGDWTNS